MQYQWCRAKSNKVKLVSLWTAVTSWVYLLTAVLKVKVLFMIRIDCSLCSGTQFSSAFRYKLERQKLQEKIQPQWDLRLVLGYLSQVLRVSYLALSKTYASRFSWMLKLLRNIPMFLQQIPSGEGIFNKQKETLFIFIFYLAKIKSQNYFGGSIFDYFISEMRFSW